MQFDRPAEMSLGQTIAALPKVFFADAEIVVGISAKQFGGHRGGLFGFAQLIAAGETKRVGQLRYGLAATEP
jgi:hypothetical protein